MRETSPRETRPDCARCARSTHPFLLTLGPEVGALRQHRRDRVYRRGAILFRQGEIADEVFCISGATVKLTHAPKTGRDAVVGVVGCGEIAGLSAALGPGRHPYTAEVVAAGRMGCISLDLLTALGDARPAFALALAGLVADEAHRAIRQAALFSEPRLAPRLAAVLLELSARPGPCGRVVGQGLKRADLAGLCGAGTEAVVRCLGRWKKKGLVSTHGGPVTLLNPEGLAAIRDGDA